MLQMHTCIHLRDMAHRYHEKKIFKSKISEFHCNLSRRILIALQLFFRYFIYPDQRRPPVGGTPTNLSKDERTSQSPTTPQSSSFKPNKSSSSSATPSSSKNSSSKDTKGDEKETKVKQEGQKPTMYVF